MEKPDLNRRGFLKALAGVAAGSVMGNEAIAREPNVSRLAGPMLQFGTYFDFIARFNKELGTAIQPLGVASGDRVVLRLKNVNGNDLDLSILDRPATEEDSNLIVIYEEFKEILLAYARHEL